MTVPVPAVGEQVLDSWAVSVASRLNGGTAFPGGPATNDRFYRTDLGMEFFYAGSWLSTELFHTDAVDMETSQPYSVTSSGVIHAPFPGTAHGNSDIYLVRSVTSFYIAGGGSALSGSHKWVCTGVKQPSGSALAAAVSTIASGASGTWRSETVTHNALLTAGTAFEVELTWTKTGTPGTLRALTSFFYRLVAV